MLDILDLFQKRDYSKIIEYFEKETLNGLSEDELNIVGIAYYYNHELEKALKIFEKLMSFDINNPDIFYNALVVYYESNRKEAKNVAEKYINTFPKEYFPYYILGMLELTEGNLGRALEYFEKAKNLCNIESEKINILNQIEKVSKLIETVKIETTEPKRKIIVHFGYDSIYTQEFVDRVLIHLSDDFEHHVFAYTTSVKISDVRPGKVKENIFVYHLSNSNLEEITKLLFKSERIILHGNVHIEVFAMIASLGLLKKTQWVIWGNDVYDFYMKSTHSLFETLREVLKIYYSNQLKIVGTIDFVCYEFAKQKYPGIPNRVDVFYPVLDEFDEELYSQYAQKNKTNDTLNIIIGNSASVFMNHAPILKFLNEIKQKYSFNVYCPLSYGDMKYADEIEKLGKELFGERFFSLRSPSKDVSALALSKFDYSKLLAQMDIGIFNSYRSQAFWNIVKLLRYGKKIVVPKESSNYNLFTKLGFYIYSIEELFTNPEKILSKNPEEQKEHNISLVLKYFSNEECLKLWREFFAI